MTRRCSALACRSRTAGRRCSPSSSGWATTFTACDDYDFELLAAHASGDLAYTVGIERYQATTSSGATVQNTLRVTHVYRREAGGWKIVHRHGDHMPEDKRATPSPAANSDITTS